MLRLIARRADGAVCAIAVNATAAKAAAWRKHIAASGQQQTCQRLVAVDMLPGVPHAPIHPRVIAFRASGRCCGTAISSGRQWPEIATQARSALLRPAAS